MEFPPLKHLQHVTDLKCSCIGSKFAGCIICFKEVRFSITSFDAFAHIENADDCSFAELHHKFKKVKSFFKVSIIPHGCIELLSNDGIVFALEDPVDAFSGSTIRPRKNHMLAGGHCSTSHSQGFNTYLTSLLIRAFYFNPSKENYFEILVFHHQHTRKYIRKQLHKLIWWHSSILSYSLELNKYTVYYNIKKRLLRLFYLIRTLRVEIQ